MSTNWSRLPVQASGSASATVTVSSSSVSESGVSSLGVVTVTTFVTVG